MSKTGDIVDCEGGLLDLEQAGLATGVLDRASTRRSGPGRPRRAATVRLRVIPGLLCSLTLSGCVHHQQAALARRHAAILGSLPAIVRTLPVDISPSFEHPVLAWTTVTMMSSHVSYNPRIAEKLPPEVLAFALVHEYAHLRLSHVAPLSIDVKSGAEIKQRELEADRFAARFWAANDPRVARAAAAAFLSTAGHEALGPEKDERETGYPTRAERARAILDCLAEPAEGD